MILNTENYHIEHFVFSNKSPNNSVKMKLFGFIAAQVVLADFRIKMQICSDANRTPTHTVKAAIGGTRDYGLEKF